MGWGPRDGWEGSHLLAQQMGPWWSSALIRAFSTRVGMKGPGLGKETTREPSKAPRGGAWTPLKLPGSEGHSPSFQGMGTACHPGCPQSTSFKV